MKLIDALKKIAPVRGHSSMVAAIMSGDLSSVSGRPAGFPLEAAKAELAKVQKFQAEATSDAAYWGYMGDVSYWRAVVNLITAADLVGPDNLPDIPAPEPGGVVMDVCAKIERWGAAVLAEAQKRS